MSAQGEFDRAFGQSLKDLRVGAGMSQEELAAEAGIDQSKLSKIERLGPPAASWIGLVKLAAALNCDVEVKLRPR